MGHLEWVLLGFAVSAFGLVLVVLLLYLRRTKPGPNTRQGSTTQRGAVSGSSSKHKKR